MGSKAGPKKLVLQKRVLKQLTESDLDGVNGGTCFYSVPSIVCPSNNTICNCGDGGYQNNGGGGGGGGYQNNGGGGGGGYQGGGGGGGGYGGGGGGGGY